MSKRLGLNLIKVTDTEMLSSFPHCMDIDYKLKAIKVMEKKPEDAAKESLGSAVC